MARKSLEASTEQIASLRRSIELRAGARPKMAFLVAERDAAAEEDRSVHAPLRCASLQPAPHSFKSGAPVWTNTWP